MGKEYRLMLLSEKSGKNYSIKMRPVMLLVFFSCCIGIIVMTVLSSVNYVNIYRKNTQSRETLAKLRSELEHLKQENREAALYKKWADSIIFRRLHYNDPDANNSSDDEAGGARAGEISAAAQGTERSQLDIDDFDVRRLNLEYDFEVSFKLINRTQGKKKITGYLYVIASNNDVKPEIYCPWPPVKLISGIPNDFKKGSKFAISYLKHIKCRIDQPAIGSKFNRVDLIAYSDDGNIIMKRGFFVERLLQQRPYE